MKSTQSLFIPLSFLSLLTLTVVNGLEALAQSKYNTKSSQSFTAQPATSKQNKIYRTYQSYPTFWPPVVGRTYPEIELLDLTGKKVKLSSFAGRLILLEPIGMSCPACQAYVGADKKGGFNGVSPQGGTASLETYLAEAGISPGDNRVVHVQLLLYGPNMGVPTLAEAREWARHFDFGRRNNEVILVGDKRYINQFRYVMIPGLQLIDKNYVLVCDATGHNPRSNLFSELIPLAGKLLRQ